MCNQREVGEVVLEYAGMRTTTKVVFALEDDVEVLDVLALEGLGLGLPPSRRS